MHTVDLTSASSALYGGCVIGQPSPGSPIENSPANRLQLMTNLLDFVKGIPEEDRDLLIIVAPIPEWIFRIVFSVMVSYFEGWHYKDETGNHARVPLNSNPS